MESLEIVFDTHRSGNHWLHGADCGEPLIDGKPESGVTKLTIVIGADGMVTVNDFLVKSLSITTKSPHGAPE